MASPQQTQATVLLSGGLDSIACAHFLQQRGLTVRGLFIDHGQVAARREAAASAALAEWLAIPIEGCALSNTHRLGAGELLGRNAMLIFNALFLSQGVSGLLALGIHAGVPYFDCSEAFIVSAGPVGRGRTGGRRCVGGPRIGCARKDGFGLFFAGGLRPAPTLR